MTARREQVNAILFSVLMITSMVAGVAALGGAAAADDTSGTDRTGANC